MRYIGLDIGRITTCAIMNGEIQSLTLRKPADLAPLIKDGDILAAEWTGRLARPYLDIADQSGAITFIYHPKKGDRNHVGEPRKDDYRDARTIAKLLQQYHEAPHFAPHTFTPYPTMKAIYDIRHLITTAQRFARLQQQLIQALGDQAPEEAIKPLREKEQATWRQAQQEIATNPATSQVAGAILKLYPTAHRSACILAAYIAPLSRFPSFPHLVSYCGLDERSLKTGYRKRTYHYREGSKQARTALYQLVKFVALTGRLRPYYDSLRRRGKDHNEAILRCMIAELRRIWRTATRGASYTPQPPKQREQQRQLQQAILELVEKGYTDAQACQALGIKQPRLSKWKARSPAFLEAYIQARAHALANRNVTIQKEEP